MIDGSENRGMDNCTYPMKSLDMMNISRKPGRKSQFPRALTQKESRHCGRNSVYEIETDHTKKDTSRQNRIFREAGQGMGR